MKYIISVLIICVSISCFAQWEPLSGPNSEGVSCLTNFNGNIISGGQSGVCFYDYIENKWIKSNNGIPEIQANNYRIEGVFSNSDILFASNHSGQLFRSHDFGNSWHYIFTASEEINNVGMHMANNDNAILFCCNFIVYRSVNNGLDWQSCLILSSDQLIYSICLYNGVFYIGTQQGKIYSSSDSGLTWSLLSSFTPLGTKVFVASGNNSLYAVSKNAKVFRSDDFGNSWVTISDELSESETQCFTSKGDSLYIGTLYDGILFSPDKGLSWTHLNNGLTARCITSILPVNMGLYASTFHGIFYKEYSANSWSDINKGLKKATTYDFIINDSTIYAANEDYNISKSHDLGNTWQQINGSISYDSAYYIGFLLDFDKLDNKLFRVHSRKGLFYSEDDGLSWAPRNNGIQCIGITQVTSCGQALFVATDSCGVYKSLDYGETWIFSGNGLPMLGFYPGLMVANNQRIYIRYYEYNTSGFSHYVSFDQGETWVESDESIYWDCYMKDSIIFTTGQDHVKLSTDYGNTWTLFNENLPTFENNYDIFCGASDGTHHFIGTQITGVYMYMDGNWVPINGGLDWQYGDHIYDLHIVNGYLYASLDRNGIWRRNIQDIIIHECSGKVFLDYDQDNTFNEADYLYPNAIVYANESNYFTTTNQNGEYSIITDVYNDTIRAQINCNYAEYYPEFYIPQQSDTAYDFAVHLRPNIKDLRIDLNNLTIPRPGSEYKVQITYSNEGTVPMNGYIDLVFDTALQFSEANPPFNSSSQDSLRWYYNTLLPFQTKAITIKFMIPVNAESGQELNCTAYINPIEEDSAKNNNTSQLKRTISASFDPNNKTVQPDSTYISPYFIQNQQELIYTINFQNTGNDTAFNITIIDTLSSNLFVPSFKIISSSHDFNYSISGHGIIEFLFSNIMLPDSTINEPQSHGYIKYSVKPKADLIIGDEIKNTAHIYFDLNEAVTTNTTNNTVSIIQKVSSKTSQSSYIIYPNPTCETLNIKTDYSGLKTIQIFDSRGSLLETINTFQTHYQIDCNNLSSGLYFININEKSDTVKFKFIKE